ncbi:MAG: M20 family metallo-hydrolase [Candidatus Brockarchaeota archaeon]|nr:M20 family metallo-hydrolase [Candidatus Brockarchaeota archaeon]MBO3768678.1 M20 family metallo-hydrolase [Candidatus Brockarchaeota archaeon]
METTISKKLLGEIESYRSDATKFLSNLISYEAIAPENGGKGEWEKANFIQAFLEKMGFDEIERYDAQDDRVPSKRRPNIVAKYFGENKEKTLWFVSHMDVVPPGALSLWKTNPFQAFIEDEKIYGRGTEDNGQAIVSSIFALKALVDLKIKPKFNVALAVVSDEETGSKYGIEHLIKSGLFKKEDLVVVPDAGNEEGSAIEVAEKSILWLKFSVTGKQTHASTPNKGINASLLGMKLGIEVYEMLKLKYNYYDNLFDPPLSTFEPTKKETNVENINTIPGRDVFYFDCRILPSYNVDEVLSSIRKFCSFYEQIYPVEVRVEEVARSEAPPPTSATSEVVQRLKQSIKLVKGIEARVVGIGGGTCAAHFRKSGIQAAVWMTSDSTAHQPNEYCKLSNLVNDAKVFSLMPII